MRVKDNPFYVLGVSPEDTLDTIESIKDDKCFMDEEHTTEYENARDILSYPQKRLEAEVRWFYSDTNAIEFAISSDLSDQVVNFNLTYRELAFYYIEKMYNLLPNTFLCSSYSNASNSYETAIQTAVNYIKSIDDCYVNSFNREELEDLYQVINYARSKASISVVSNETQVEDILRNALKEDAKNGLIYVIENNSTDFLVQVVSRVVIGQIQPYIGNPLKQYHEVIKKLLDLYNEQIQDVLSSMCQQIMKKIEEARQYTEVDQLKTLCEIVHKFSHYAKPLQIYLQDIGHVGQQNESMEIANRLYNLGIDYANENNLWDLSIAVMSLVKECFSEIPDMANKVTQDLQTLARLKSRSATFAEIMDALQSVKGEIERFVVRENGHEVQNRANILNRKGKWLNQIRMAARSANSDNEEDSTDFNMCIATIYIQLASACTWAELWDLAYEISVEGLSYAIKSGDTQFLSTYKNRLNEYKSIRERASQQENSNNLGCWIFIVVVIILFLLFK